MNSMAIGILRTVVIEYGGAVGQVAVTASGSLQGYCLTVRSFTLSHHLPLVFPVSTHLSKTCWYVD